MATQVNESVRNETWFAVDGVRVEPGAWRWYPHRFAGAVFSADFDEVRRLLPSPPLYPVRITSNRALVMAWGAQVPAAGLEPPFLGFGEVALIAYVTIGDEAAPPLLPMLGRRAMLRHGFGGYLLMLVVTNRIAAELYQRLFGVRAMVGSMRIERRHDVERFTCGSTDGEILNLTVRTSGRPTLDESAADMAFYAYEAGELYRVPVSGSGVSRCSYGHKSASLVLGRHPLARRLESLGLSESWIAEFQPDREFWPAGSPKRVATERLTAPATLPDLPGKAIEHLVVSPRPGVEFELDQGIDVLGLNPEGVFSGSALGDSAH